MGCVEQYQWCDPNSLACSAVAGLVEAQTAFAENLNMSRMQQATVELLANLIRTSATLPGAVLDNAILANQGILGDLFQMSLPDNQWQIELQAWHSIVMTSLQQSLLYWVLASSTYPVLLPYMTHPNSSEEVALCSRQRVRLGPGGGFANFSGFGLLFTVTLGTLITLVNLFLDNIAGLVGRFSPTAREKQRVWIRDDALHLQRLAYTAEAQAGVWTGYDIDSVWAGVDSNVPRVIGDTLLGPLVESEGDELRRRPRVRKQYVILSSEPLNNTRDREN
ncbi:hypothetical protein NKR23_g11933 [Pleurostoma richardsiae]|uniref:Uncharacterized protein n=1 Tax=Pleurostoma richardsiae TaxID=41990 RepID=A0AA38R2R1_9PEZI|nr:hypothetical protein NKR23_g11933 [Pleurostoma richardsiae]